MSEIAKVDKEEEKCLNNCGYYGNPAWNGYCSICYKQSGAAPSIVNQPTKTSSARSGSFFNTIVSVSARKPSSLTDQKRTASFPKIFNPTPLNSIVVGQPQLPRFTKNFQQYLANDSLPRPVAKEVHKALSLFLCRFLKHYAYGVEVNKQAHAFARFYSLIRAELEKLAAYKAMDENDSYQLFVAMETELVTLLNGYIVRSGRDEEEDMQLNGTIKSLRWITSDMVGSPISDKNPICVDLFENAMATIMELEAFSTPLEKFDCLRRCSEFIVKAAQTVTNSPSGADELIPALIYVLLKANPPLLLTNLRFINRFSFPQHVGSTETGYLYTTYSCAVHVIRNMDAKQLGISERLFEEYRSGRAVPPEETFPSAHGPQRQDSRDEQLMEINEIWSDVQEKMELVKRRLVELKRKRMELVDTVRSVTGVDVDADRK